LAAIANLNRKTKVGFVKTPDACPFYLRGLLSETTAANVPGLENVANLGDLPPTGAWVIALPMKIAWCFSAR
jgi:hypothetical protein